MSYFDFNDFKSLFRGIVRDERADFEKEFAAYVGAAHAIGASYGRTALYLGLKSIGAAGGEVLVPAFTCTVVRQAIVLSGATPRFVDIDSETFDMDLDDLKRKMTSRTKAIVLTHYFGRAAGNLQKVIRFAHENNIALVEDCAHSLGAEFEGRKIGTFGDFAVFSLTKNMLNFGGGFLVTNDGALYAKAREMLLQEERPVAATIKDFFTILSYGTGQMIYKLIFDRVGNRKSRWLLHLPQLVSKVGNYLSAVLDFPRKILFGAAEKKDYGQRIAMASAVASLGRSQLSKIDSLISRRKKIYETLAGNPHLHFRRGLSGDDGGVCTHVVIRSGVSDIFKVIDQCLQEGISLVATWPTRQKKWRHLDSPNMRRIEKELLVLCLNPDLTDREVDHLTRTIGGIERMGASEAAEHKEPGIPGFEDSSEVDRPLIH